MKKLLWLTGFLFALAGSGQAQLFDVSGGIHTNAARDSVQLTFIMLSTDAKTDTTADSVVFLRHRVDGSADGVFVDRIQTTVDTFNLANYAGDIGSFTKVVRASDGSGTPGTYFVLARAYKNGSALRQHGVASYQVFDSFPGTWTGSPRPIFAVKSTDTVRSDARLHLGTAYAAPTVGGVPEVDITHFDGVTSTWNPIHDNDSLIVDKSTFGGIPLTVGTNNDKTGYTLSAAGIQAVRDTLRKLVFNVPGLNLLPNGDFEADDSTGIGQVPSGWTGPATDMHLTGQYGTVRPRHGRYAFTPGADILRSDSIWMVQGQPYYFGVWTLLDTTSFPAIFPTVRVNGANLVSIVNSTNIANKYPTSGGASARRWVLFDTVFTATASGRCRVTIEGEGAVNDSVWFDQITLVPFAAGDTAANARAVWDNDFVAEGNRTGRMHTFKTDTVQARTFPSDTVKTVTDPISATAVIPDIANMIRNPHFETGSGDLPVAGWREATAQDAKISTANPNSGIKALRKFGVCGAVEADSIYLAAGTNVVITGRIFTSTLTGVSIDLLISSGSIPAVTAPARLTGDWHTVTASGRIPTSGRYRFLLRGPTAGGSDSTWFDDVSLLAFPDTLGLATVQQAVLAGTFTDTIFTRNMSTGTPVGNVGVLVKTLSGTSLGQIKTDPVTGKVVAGFNAGTYLLYPNFVSGVNWRMTDNPDTFVVTGNGQTDTIRGDTFDPGTPPDPSQCIVWQNVTGRNGKWAVNAHVVFTLQADSSKIDSALIGVKQFEGWTDTLGCFRVPVLINSLIQPAGSYYEVSIMDSDGTPLLNRSRVVVPNQASWRMTF